jgi:hypothetical protein
MRTKLLLIPIAAILLMGAASTRLSVKQLLTSTPTSATVKLYGSQDGNTFVPVTLGTGITQTLASGVLTLSASGGSSTPVLPVIGITVFFNAGAGSGFVATIPAGTWSVVLYRNGLRQVEGVDYVTSVSGTSLSVSPILYENGSWPSTDLVIVDLFPK